MMTHLSGTITEGPPPITRSSCEEHSAVMMGSLWQEHQKISSVSAFYEQDVFISSIMTGCTLSGLKPRLSHISSLQLRLKTACLPAHYPLLISTRSITTHSSAHSLLENEEKTCRCHLSLTRTFWWLEKPGTFQEKVRCKDQYSRMTLLWV